ncbi:MAG: hypothetical protein WCP21_24505, partial [Armatimonadota bacterium]
MDCLDCQEQFSAVMEDSVSALAQASREHLDACPACHALYASFLQTVRRLRELPVVSPPAGLLRAIGRAVDREARPRTSWPAYWQPLTAGLSMAACCLMVMWAVVLHPTSAIGPANIPQLAQVDYSLMTPPTPPAGNTRAVTAAPPAPLPPRRGVARSMRMVRPGPVASRGPQLALKPLPDSFGSWSHAVPAAAPSATAGAAADSTGKPAESFAAGDPTETPAKPLNKTPGEVNLTFTPPAERVVGTLAIGQLLVIGQAEANVTIRLQPRAGLRVLNTPDGILYQGALRQGQKLELPVRMIALRPGAQRLQLSVEADVAGVGTQMPILIPGFAPAPAGNGEKIVGLAFQDTPSVRVIRELAAVAGVRVVLDDNLDRQLVTYDF